MRVTAAISREGDWFVAQCLEVDIASQGRSVAEAREHLVEALTLHVDDHDVEVAVGKITRRSPPGRHMG